MSLQCLRQTNVPFMISPVRQNNIMSVCVYEYIYIIIHNFIVIIVLFYFELCFKISVFMSISLSKTVEKRLELVYSLTETIIGIY